MVSKRDRLLASLPAALRVPAFYYLQKLLGCAEQELSNLHRLVPRGTVAIDVGANQGMYVYPLSRLAVRVEAFEPLPFCADFLERSRANLTVHRIALSDHEGIMTLHVPLINGIRHSGLATFQAVRGPQEFLDVPVRTLDSFHFSNVGLIKIDVEGHEHAVLRGAEETLRRERPNVLIEIEQRHHVDPMEHIFAAMATYGYDGFFLQNDDFRPLSEFSYESHQAPYLDDVKKGNDALIRGKYINMFFFRPKEGARPLG